MATSFPATTSSSSTVVAKIPTTTTTRRHFYHHSPPKLSFPVSPKPKLRLFSSKPLPSRMVVVKSQLNKVAVEGSNNAPATPEAKSGIVKETKIDEPTKGSSATELSEESISEFINQVSDLVKLVDSRDIVELKLKQLDCEILIRKKLAVEPTQSPPPYAMMHSPPPMATPTSHAPPPASVPALPAPKSAAPAATPAKSSIPPILSPMAVQKGQVLCIIEAMKLMNEIQAEQAGTVVEVIAEDAKPVSKDSGDLNCETFSPSIRDSAVEMPCHVAQAFPLGYLGSTSIFSVLRQVHGRVNYSCIHNGLLSLKFIVRQEAGCYLFSSPLFTRLRMSIVQLIAYNHNISS
ncbi:hypothetical protein KSS87_016815 [Heliosperma pusillum]|nr:hypothetical protein KSS87_016815 [Heliosperma pusillum]